MPEREASRRKREKLDRVLRAPLRSARAAPDAGPPAARPDGAALLLARLQARLQRRGRLYGLLRDAVAPVLTSRAFRAAQSDLLRRYGEDHVVVNLGCGPVPLPGREDVIGVDATAYEQVDVVADAADLPLRDGVVDLLLCVACLEHVPDARAVVAEVRRVLKPGGRALCYVPFLQPFHAAPSDYARYTAPGLRGLFADGFEVEGCGVGSGPTAALLWTLQEWVATVGSAGSPALHDVLLAATMLATAPLKLLDRAVERLPAAENAASAFYVVARRASG